MRRSVITFATVTALSALAISPALSQEPATATFIDADGSEVGSATLTGTPHGVLIDVIFTGLPAGDHAFHIHETGICDAADGFDSAGGHFNPNGKEHGLMVEGGPHAGDMPNQTWGEDGAAFQVLNTMVTLEQVAGKALMVHSGTDDYTSQPSGDAGSRIACAEISG